MISKRNRILRLIRTISLTGVCIFGLITIIGTGDDNPALQQETGSTTTQVAVDETGAATYNNATLQLA